MSKRKKEHSVSPPASKMRQRNSSSNASKDKRDQQPAPADYTSIVGSGIRWLLVLAFVILVLIAIEEISVVVFERQPSQNFTPTLISALTAIIGGILFFFRVLVRHYRNNHRDDED